MVEGGMSLGQAASVFTKLTIGDGLVSQVPAFLISLSAGLLVTRSSYEVNLPSEFLRQLFSRPQALAVAGGIPGGADFHELAAIPLLLIGGSCVGMAVMINRAEDRRKRLRCRPKPKRRSQKPPTSGSKTISRPTRWKSRLGVGLIQLADPKRGGDLLQRIQRVRQNIAAEMGIIMPKVRIRDNMRLEANQYRIKIADMAVGRRHGRSEQLLAMDSGLTTGKLRGIAMREPAFNTPAALDRLRRSATRPRCSATPSSNRPACWPRI